MRCRDNIKITAILTSLSLLIWGIFIVFDVQSDPLQMIGFNYGDQPKDKFTDTVIKCSLSKACPPDTFDFHIWSGAANVVGPKICFNGKIIMSHVLNNIGPGINIVVVNGERGDLEKFGYFNMISGGKNNILEYLKTIKPGSIVLVASYMNVTPRMTDEIRDVFESMGSRFIQSLKKKDGWIFAGKIGAKEKSLFERVSVNDEKTNIYDEWPHVVEMGGCYPMTIPGEDESEASQQEDKV
ncbi:protein FAM3C [Notolabrus celidotus]|uniref:protein FAM3C n=1 Tax=Notolabrus celidotus TaxID=1203425 RepID=UPI00148FF9F8|nr:protein FAM3C [Notolabrus celidotus]